MKLLAFICLCIIGISLITGMILAILERKGNNIYPSSENDAFKNYMDFDSTLSSISEEKSSKSTAPEMDEEII